MTALAAILDSVLEPSFLIMVGPIAVVAALFIWAEHRADREWEDVETDPAKVDATRDDANAASLAYWAETNPELMREAEQRWRAGAARRRGQDLPPVAGIGNASLDEIRREWDGGSPDVA